VDSPGGVFCLNLPCIGAASLIITSLASFPLLGIVLIGQTILFMMFILGLARLTPLEADHPSYRGGAPAVIIARMEQIRGRLFGHGLDYGLVI
jgi:hypothetical protein